MDESVYNQRVAAAFKRIMTAADAVDPDTLEADSTGDMVTLTAASREKCIINTQRAVRQIWVAGQGEGIHFSHDEARALWVDDKGRGIELFAFVAHVVKSLCGAQLALP